MVTLISLGKNCVVVVGAPIGHIINDLKGQGQDFRFPQIPWTGAPINPAVHQHAPQGAGDDPQAS